MARIVKEIMNRELYAAGPNEPVGYVLHDLTELGVSGCPVVDEDQRLLGVVSIRDLFDGDRELPIRAKMSTPPIAVMQDAPIRDAARLMAEAGVHRIVVVDGERAVGIVSSLDVIRGLLGLPSRHPATFPHYDLETGLIWTDDHPLDAEHVEVAPDAPGVILLIQGGANRTESIVWGESADNVRERLFEYVETPAEGPLLLSYWRKRSELRFRAAALEDPHDREAVLDRLVTDVVP